MTTERYRRLALFVAGLIVLTVWWLSNGYSTILSEEPLTKHTSTDSTLKFLIEPYLQFPTQNSIRILWETNQAGSTAVLYDKAGPVKYDPKTKKPMGPKLEMRVEGRAGEMHEVLLDKLEPSTRYIYQVQTTTAGGQIIQSDYSTFLTAVREDEAWSFTVVGDTQRNPEITGRIAKQMWERRPHFVMHCGDVVDDGREKNQWLYDLFQPSNQLFRRVALLPTIGNHEKNDPQYYQYFSLPDPKYYYRFRYGNAEFFSIDTNSLRNLTPSGEQYVWLDQALADSKATWKIVFHHHPAFSSDDDDFGYSWYGKSGDGEPRVQQHLVKLYEKHQVDLVFNGHIHVYERTWPLRDGKVDHVKGTIYVTSGGGGGRLEDFTPTPHWFKAEQRSSYHYCYVTVHNGTLHFKAFDVEGRLFDAMSLNKKR
ncbi:MAG TPA: metallophosphoesterase family protein [Gemmatales bacterium]|nr:metallophosphoesterase family protein [Gemmatales bacterium]HMP17583.1 metallophosphoesterase family protein [Gemmatales bacterium]